MYMCIEKEREELETVLMNIKFVFPILSKHHLSLT